MTKPTTPISKKETTETDWQYQNGEMVRKLPGGGTQYRPPTREEFDQLLTNERQALLEQVEGLKEQYKKAMSKKRGGKRLFPEDVDPIEVLEDVIDLLKKGS